MQTIVLVRNKGSNNAQVSLRSLDIGLTPKPNKKQIIHTMKNLWFKQEILERQKTTPILFCFPYAGGTSNIFRPWQGYIGDALKICPIRLPGREMRIREPLYKSMDKLIFDLASDLKPYLSQPYAFFGHSMGGIIAHLLTLKLMENKTNLPAALFIAARGWQEPSPELLQKIALIEDDDFLDLIGGMSPGTTEALSNPIARKLFLPILKADYELCCSWQIKCTTQPIDVPIFAMHGSRDIAIPLERMQAWSTKTTQSFELQIFQGDHFFIHNRYPEMLDWIKEKISEVFLKI